MEKLSYTTEFTLWPVPHARPLIDGKPEPGAHPAEYLHPGKLHLETSDDNYVDLYIVPPLFKPGYPPGYQFYADLIFSNIYIAENILTITKRPVQWEVNRNKNIEISFTKCKRFQ